MNEKNAFDRMAPFIQEFIYKNNWDELRPMQIEAAHIIFDTHNNLLLSSGTASGKTEAAFFPIISILHDNPSASVGALYIGPLKALINDQFERLSLLLKEADINVWHWHGDVSATEKKRLLKNPSGILQITPESLEALLMQKTIQAVKLFYDLRFIIIDEVHVFMNSDRGYQVLCLLERIQRITNNIPRRIGLSATIGNLKEASYWLGNGTGYKVETPVFKSLSRTIRLSVDNFIVKDDKSLENYNNFIYDNVNNRKAIIFTNTRGEAEEITGTMKTIAEDRKDRDIFHVHHGSVSAAFRETAERAMREENSPMVTTATITLELGIDIGKLERIIQLGSPFTCSSFVQRLGRSGRRDGISEMLFVTREKVDERKVFPENINWELLQSISIIQLYIKNKFVEPIDLLNYPFSLLYHQTMSIMTSMGEMRAAELARQMLSMPAFKNITQEDYKLLLKHLISIGHLQKTDEGGLIIGLGGEGLVNNFKFYAVFKEDLEYKVYDGSKEIGGIISPLNIGQQFALAGKTWEIIEVDYKRKRIYVVKVKGRAKAAWDGGGGFIHDEILKEMCKVLIDDESYRFLKPSASVRLQELRREFSMLSVPINDETSPMIIPAGGDTYYILPWMGTRKFMVLYRLLNLVLKNTAGIASVGGYEPYYLKVSMIVCPEELIYLIKKWCSEYKSALELLGDDETPFSSKYDEFIPSELVIKSFVYDVLDVKGFVDYFINVDWRVVK